MRDGLKLNQLAQSCILQLTRQESICRTVSSFTNIRRKFLSDTKLGKIIAFQIGFAGCSLSNF